MAAQSVVPDYGEHNVAEEDGHVVSGGGVREGENDDGIGRENEKEDESALPEFFETTENPDIQEDIGDERYDVIPRTPVEEREMVLQNFCDTPQEKTSGVQEKELLRLPRTFLKRDLPTIDPAA